MSNPYKINGIALTMPADAGIDATAPDRHIVSKTQANIVATVGGHIATDPPSGISTVHTWKFGKRTTRAVDAILSMIGLNRVCEIATYDTRRSVNGVDTYIPS